MVKPEIGTKRQCSNCGAKFFDLRKTPIVCPKCGAVYQVEIKAREVFRGAAKPIPATKVEDSEVELVSLDEVQEGEDKVAGVAEDDLEPGVEPADDALLRLHSMKIYSLSRAALTGPLNSGVPSWCRLPKSIRIIAFRN